MTIEYKKCFDQQCSIVFVGEITNRQILIIIYCWFLMSEAIIHFYTVTKIEYKERCDRPFDLIIRKYIHF